MPDEDHDSEEKDLVKEKVNKQLSTLDLDNLPKLYQHCVRLYELMEEAALVDQDDPDEKMYVGSITPLIVDLDIAPSYQSKIIGRLRLMGCVSMLKRGSGAAKSVWGLYKNPTIADFNASDGTGDINWRKEQKKFDATNQRIKDLTRRMSILEDWARSQGAPL